jgi:thymidylate synthase
MTSSGSRGYSLLEPVLMPFNKAWFTVLEQLCLHGQRVSPRGHLCQEIRNVSFRCPMADNILDSPERDLNYRFMIAEWLWISLGREDVASIARYNQNVARFSDNGKSFFGAYGPRWLHQRQYILKNLESDKDSRQAVAVIWQKNPPKSKDIPCTLTFQFLVRDSKLHMTVSMRSSDVWLGLPYDFFNFSQLGNEVAGELMLERGDLTMHLCSSHLYASNADAATEILSRDAVPGIITSPPRHGFTGPVMNRYLLDATSSVPLGWSVSDQDRQYAAALAHNKQHALEVLRALAPRP